MSWSWRDNELVDCPASGIGGEIMEAIDLLSDDEQLSAFVTSECGNCILIRAVPCRVGWGGA